MALIHVQAERTINATPERVHAVLADYRGRHAEILPPENYLDYHVEQGGTGAGTVFAYRLRAARRERPYTLRVSEPTPGTVITENDTSSSLVTTWTLEPQSAGQQTRVRLTTEWQGASGVGGFFERTFAPGGLHRLYDAVLARLDTAAAGASGNTAPDGVTRS